MISVDFTGPALETNPAAYSIAGEVVRVNTPLESLARFNTSVPDLPVTAARQERAVSEKSVTRRFTGWLAARLQDVEVRCDSSGYSIALDASAQAFVSSDGGHVEVAHPSSAVGCPFEGVLQPALILALALRGTYCLHASAVEAGGKAIAFLGESGVGKSTIARHLSEDHDLAWWCLGDDVLPVARPSSQHWVLPRFPQLKLGDAQSEAASQPARVPLRAAYLVTPGSGAAAQRGVRTEPMKASAGLVAVVRHTVASRLFGPPLLRRHLEFCAELVREVPLRSLVYPHRPKSLKEVRELIEADVSQLVN